MVLNISIVSDKNSWINHYIVLLIEYLEQNKHNVIWLHDCKNIKDGDLAFYLGYSHIVSKDILARNKNNLVVHESALPLGKGWSPLTWQILEGKNEIPITLFEASEKVDSGKIYLQKIMRFNGTELIDNLRKTQGELSVKLCLSFVEQYPDIIERGIEQQGKSSYYPRRTPKDSILDPNKTIREQFNLLRVVDNQNYPAFFQLEGKTYILKIEQKNEHRTR